MITAFAFWENRIAPVLDVARHVCIAGSGTEKIYADLPGNSLQEKASFLEGMSVEALICGAVSRPLQWMIASKGIRIVPFVSGELEAVIQAWFSGRFRAEAFRMPGCGIHGRIGGNSMRNGMGKGGRGGRMGGPAMAGPGGFCVCPACGRREPHVRGMPCAQRKCPVCGNVMVRDAERGS